MKLLTILIALHIFTPTCFSGELEDIDARIAEIELRLPNLGQEVSAIQVEIGTVQGNIDPINDAIAIIDDSMDEKQNSIDLKESSIEDIQSSIDLKVIDRDALPVDDPQIPILQEEINLLIVERDALQAEIPILQAEVDQLLLDREAQVQLRAPFYTQLEALNLQKSELLVEETGLQNEKISLVERKRIITWNARVRALPDLRLCMVEAGLNQPNAKVFVRDLISNNEEAKLIALESVVIQVQNILDAASAKENNRKAARTYIRGLDASLISDLILRNLVLLMQ